MISFKQFLAEDDASSVTPLEAAKYVVEHCQDFLKEINFNISHNENYARISSPMLYRGMGNFALNKGYVLSGTRPRTPIDSSKDLTETLDEYFKKRFGYEYRKKGVFCSGSGGFAGNYGNVFLIFPTDGFDAIWSEEIEDAYTALDYRKNGETPVFARRICLAMNEDDPFANEELEEDDKWKEWYRIVWQWLEEHHPYKDADILNGMLCKVKPEIMLRCKEYVAIPRDGAFMHEFVEEMLELL